MCIRDSYIALVKDAVKYHCISIQIELQSKAADSTLNIFQLYKAFIYIFLVDQFFLFHL